MAHVFVVRFLCRIKTVNTNVHVHSMSVKEGEGAQLYRSHTSVIAADEDLCYIIQTVVYQCPGPEVQTLHCWR